MTGHQRDRAEDDVVCSLQLHFTQSRHTPYCEYFESLFQQQTIQALGCMYLFTDYLNVLGREMTSLFWRTI